MTPYRTLVELLCERAESMSRSPAFTFLDHRHEARDQTLSYAELDRRARSVGIAVSQAAAAREPILLLFEPGLDYLVGFFGALYGGAIAVPAYPPHPARLQRTLPRLLSLLENSGARTILTTAPIASMREALREVAPALAECTWIAVDDLDTQPEDWSPPALEGSDICFLQYTSGSTSEPKGVMVTHANLIANQAMIAAGMGNDETTVGMSWLPMYHDMGLIGHIIQPLYLGIHSYLMSPLAFLARPIRWLRAISEHRATTSGGPNFAYDLCVRKVKDEEVAELDLGSWRTAYSGAEPVREATLRRFHAKFAPAGLRWESLFPCYGLAEATLFVSGGPASTGPKALRVEPRALETGRVSPAEEGHSLMRCGVTPPNEEVRIVDPESRRPCGPGEIGEIWVQGPHVARGYWRDAELSREVFGAYTQDGQGPFLRTGDLGVVEGSELVVTGRLKDLVIVGGRNHYPQDIELTIERCHPSVRQGCSAAFTVELRDEERLVVAVEVERRYRPDRRQAQREVPEGTVRKADRRQDELSPAHEPDAPARWDADEVVEVMRQAVWRSHELPIHAIALLRPGIVPRTSSGKIRRRETRAMYLGASLEAITVRVVGGSDAPARMFVPPETSAEKSLARIWQEVLGVPRVGRDDVFVSLGGDSVKAAQVVWKARESGLDLTLQSMFEHPSLRALAAATSDRATPVPRQVGAAGSAVSGRPSPLAVDILERGPGSVGHAIVRAIDIDPSMLRRALAPVLEHHHELRRRAVRVKGQWQTSTADVSDALVLEVEGLPALSASDEDALLREHVDRLASRLDRAGGVRLACAQLIHPAGPGGRRSSRLVMVADSAAVDHVSWWSLLDDLDRSYRCLEREREVRLPPHGDAEAFGAQAWERAARTPTTPTRLWLAQLDLPTRLLTTRGDEDGGERTTHRVHVTDMQQTVEALTSSMNISIGSFFSTAVLMAARDWTGGRSARIDVHTSGREWFGGSLARTIGRFATSEPLGVDLSGSTTPSGALGIVTRHVTRLGELAVPFAALALAHPDPSVRRRVRDAEPAQITLRYGSSTENSLALQRLGYATVVSDEELGRFDQVGLALAASAGELELTLSYQPSIFDEAEVGRFADRCLEAVRALVGAPSDLRSVQRLAEVSLDEEELNSALARAVAARRGKP